MCINVVSILRRCDIELTSQNVLYVSSLCADITLRSKLKFRSGWQNLLAPQKLLKIGWSYKISGCILKLFSSVVISPNNYPRFVYNSLSSINVIRRFAIYRSIHFSHFFVGGETFFSD